MLFCSLSPGPEELPGQETKHMRTAATESLEPVSDLSRSFAGDDGKEPGAQPAWGSVTHDSGHRGTGRHIPGL